VKRGPVTLIRRPVARVTPDVVGAKRMLARNAYRLRKALGMTQFVASERAGIDIRAWQKVEYEDTNATITTIARVAAALDAPIAELFRPLTHPS
jgi:transcriptional regulator with XRE-family HTH domain